MIIRPWVHPFALGCLLLSMALADAARGQSLDGTLKKSKDTGAITIATRGASIPFNYLDDDNRQTGYAWEISQRGRARQAAAEAAGAAGQGAGSDPSDPHSAKASTLEVPRCHTCVIGP